MSSAFSVTGAEPAPDKVVEQALEKLPIEDVTDYPDEDQSVRNALSRPVTMTADRVPLRKVVQALADEYGLSVCIHNGALQKTEFRGDVANVPVSIRPNERLDSALEDMLDDVGLDFQIAHWGVSINSRDTINLTREIRVYDVSPLVGHDASSMDVANLLRRAIRNGEMEAQGHGSLLIVRYHRHGHALVLKKLNTFTRHEVREVAATRARAVKPIAVPRPAPPKKKLQKVTLLMPAGVIGA